VLVLLVLALVCAWESERANDSSVLASNRYHQQQQIRLYLVV